MTLLQIGDGPLEEIGGKAAGLATLQRLGLPVPSAVVVPASAHGVLADPNEVVRLLGEPMAVRSSGLHEDTGGRSAAGQYDSVMGVTAGNLVEAVRQVYRSGSSSLVQTYTGSAETAMAVVIQREIPSTKAGVAFSRHPVTGAEEVLIEVVFGHGEKLVSGQVNPDRFRVTGPGTVHARLAVREGRFRTLRTLRDDEAQQIAELTQRTALSVGHPVDIEFCIEGRRLWLLQCRAITTR
jgi:phosphoenolpyruvate synthase/pyruvate phosphate dikinase